MATTSFTFFFIDSALLILCLFITLIMVQDSDASDNYAGSTEYDNISKKTVFGFNAI
jgi:hypothetical protein